MWLSIPLPEAAGQQGNLLLPGCIMVPLSYRAAVQVPPDHALW